MTIINPQRAARAGVTAALAASVAFSCAPVAAIAQDAGTTPLASAAASQYGWVIGQSYTVKTTWSGDEDTLFGAMNAIIKQMVGKYFGDSVQIVPQQDGTFNVVIGFKEYSAAIEKIVHNGREIVPSAADASGTFTFNVASLDKGADIKVFIGGAMAGMFDDGVAVSMAFDSADFPAKPAVDKTALIATIAYANAIQQGSKTDAAYAALWTDITAAQAVANDDAADQAAVDAAVHALQDSMTAFDTSADKPVETGPVDDPADGTADKPTEKPADKPAGKPTEAPVDQPAEKPANGSVDTPAEQPADGPANKPVDKPANGSADGSVEKPADGTADAVAVAQPFEEGKIYTVPVAYRKAGTSDPSMAGNYFAANATVVCTGDTYTVTFSTNLAVDQKGWISDVTVDGQAVQAVEDGNNLALSFTTSDITKVFALTMKVQPMGGNAVSLDMKLNVLGAVEGDAPAQQADKSQLTAAIADAQKLEQGKKSDKAWSDLQDAIKAAQAVADNKDASQAQVDAAVTALNGAVDAFNRSAESGTPTTPTTKPTTKPSTPTTGAAGAKTAAVSKTAAAAKASSKLPATGDPASLIGMAATALTGLGFAGAGAALRRRAQKGAEDRKAE